MAKQRRTKGEGTYGERTINGTKYKYYKSPESKFIYAKTTKELSVKVKEYRSNQESEDHLKNNKDGTLTLYEYSKDWLKSIGKTIKPKTYDGYETYIENIINNRSYMFGGMQINSIQKRHVQNFIDDLSDSYARATIQKIKVILNQVFEKAIDDGIVLANPVTKTKIPIEENISKKKKEIVILEKDDVVKFKKQAEKTYKNGKPIYGINGEAALFILYTGLRAGELIQLEWSNIDLENEVMYISSNSSYVKNRNKENENDNNYITIKTSTKSKDSKREIPLTNEAIKILEHRKECKVNNLVFTPPSGEKISNSNLDKSIKRIAKEANLNVDYKLVTAHPLRHTFASQLLANGVEISIVSKLLGHSKVSTTYDIYIHLMKDSKKDAIKILDDIY